MALSIKIRNNWFWKIKTCQKVVLLMWGFGLLNWWQALVVGVGCQGIHIRCLKLQKRSWRCLYEVFWELTFTDRYNGHFFENFVLLTGIFVLLLLKGASNSLVKFLKLSSTFWTTQNLLNATKEWKFRSLMRWFLASKFGINYWFWHNF